MSHQESKNAQLTPKDYPGERMIRRLFDTLAENGIGTLLQPWHLRRQLPCKEVLQQLDALSLSWRNISDDPAKQVEDSSVGVGEDKSLPASGNMLRPCSSARSDLARTITQEVVADGLRQQVNVSKAVLFAEAALAGDHAAPPDARVDTDWLHRWRQRAGDISGEELSLLWGRILAGEIKHPGTCSLRSLEFLSNLSREEALEIERVAPFVLETVLIKHDGLLEKAGVSIGLLSGLQELGLISGIGSSMTTSVKTQVEGEFQFTWELQRLGKSLLISHTDPTKKLRIPVLHVGRLGKEVFAVAQSAPSEECLIGLVMLIEAQDFSIVIEDL